ncbi:heavy-metal-associated domain-containing protein [Rhizobacter sp. Root1221]|uniref:heavy-metal-associated domain-containing protein n=1 Tax=Rhizobacter sp. Root1221 TaxID=1736433 RepID=UPI0009E910EC
MKTFQVNDMTCGHCVDAVTKAVKGIDPAAHVSVNLATKRLEVDFAAADARSIQSAIAVAGYTAVEETGSAEPVQGARSSSCCGSCP